MLLDSNCSSFRHHFWGGAKKSPQLLGSFGFEYVIQTTKETDSASANGRVVRRCQEPLECANLRGTNLHEMHSDLDMHGRENTAVNKDGAIFIIAMGLPTSDGSASEEVRSPWHEKQGTTTTSCSSSIDQISARAQ